MTTRTWFITGVNSGFGRELAGQLLARGDRVAGTVRREGSADDLKAAYGDRFWLGHLDVTDLPKVREVVDAAFADLGRIDVVVVNAGYGLFGAAEELTDEQVTHQITTNLLGAVQTARAALPHLRAQGGGRLIQISSVAGLAAYDGTPGAFVRTFRDAPPLLLGDPAKVAARVIASADRRPAPLRLVLGSDSYQASVAALRKRLAEVEAQAATAAETDATQG